MGRAQADSTKHTTGATSDQTLYIYICHSFFGNADHLETIASAVANSLTNGRLGEKLYDSLFHRVWVWGEYE
jgi:hypothetical protein